MVRKFVLESKKQQKRDCWMTEVFRERPDLKKRDNFESEEDYKGYLISRTLPVTFNCCRLNYEGITWNVLIFQPSFLEKPQFKLCSSFAREFVNQ